MDIHRSKKAPLILANNLSRIYSYGEAKVIGLRSVDMTINSGEFVVLKGISGSGKSTLLSIIAGLDKPSGGSIVVAGYDLNSITSKQLTQYRRKVVGMVFQSFNLLPTLTVIENICLPAILAGKSYEKVHDRSQQYIKWLDLEKRINHFPFQLSGGEMQRTAIARALINNPKIILADEPTGNLDTQNGIKVIHLLSELNQKFGCTLILATHSNLADSFATMEISLKDGKICKK